MMKLLEDVNRKNGGVVLIYPSFALPSMEDFNIPLGLLHLGTYLDGEGYRVELIDCSIKRDYKELIYTYVKEGAICVGISAMTAQLPNAIEICSFIRKEMNTNIPIVFGGVHTTLFPKQMVLYPEVDFAVIGEGELSMVRLLSALEGKCNIDSVEGLAYLDQRHQPKITSKNENFDFNKLPFVNYELLGKDMVKRFSDSGRNIGMLTSRGCPYKCTFCINTIRPENRRLRSWNVDRIVRELERLIEDYGAQKIWFWDDGFFVDKNRIFKLMDEVERKHLVFEWFAEPRADYFRDDYLNEDVLKRLYRLGCRKFGIGAESGSPRILRYLEKDITLNNIIRSAELCEKSNIQPTYSFMTGLPTETSKEVRMTVSFIEEISRVCYKSRFLGPQLYRPYPGSKLYEDCKRYGLEEPKRLEEWIDVIKTNLMETDVFNMPWIKNPYLVKTVWFYGILISIGYNKLINLFLEYCNIYKINYFKIICGLFGITFIRLLGTLRYNLNWHRFPIEMKLLKKYRAVISC